MSSKTNVERRKKEWLEKITQRRRSRRGRSSNPILAFMDKWIAATEALEIIQSKRRKKGVVQEARKQCLISCVTAFEVYFKDLLEKLIKQKKVNYDKLIAEHKKNYLLSDVLMIVKKRIKPEEVIVDSYNFLDLDQINSAYSAGLGIDVFNKIKGYKWYYGEKERDEYIEITADFYPELDKTIKQRHEFVHEIDFKLTIKKDDLEKRIRELIDFVWAFDDFLGKTLNDKESIN